MKRILTALLVLLLLVSAVACSAEKEIPDGYFSVSLSDEIFDLYVPGTWQNNSSSSISSAIYSQGSAVYVSAYSQKAETTKIVLADYVDAMIESYEEQFSDFEVTSEVKDTTLDSFAAQTFDYKMKVNDKTMLLRNIVAKNENMFTTLTYCAPEADFETHLADFESMVLYFTFREFEVETFVLEDEHTPDGFLMASGDKYEFRFFVPDTWKVDMYSAIPRAYYSDIELSNVSLTSFAVTDTIKTGKDYWNSFKTIYERDYVLSVISEVENGKMGGRDALAVEYTTVVGGYQYCIKQVFINTSSMIYVLTYTSDEASYALHLDDVTAMIENFEFK